MPVLRIRPAAAAARRRPAGERGDAAVDFVLIMMILIPLILAILHFALVLHVRNTLASAASEGARLAGTIDRDGGDGVARTREEIRTSIAGRYADGVSIRPSSVHGAPGWEVTVRAQVPAMGMWGPATDLTVEGHAVEEVPPGE